MIWRLVVSVKGGEKKLGLGSTRLVGEIQPGYRAFFLFPFPTAFDTELRDEPRERPGRRA